MRVEGRVQVGEVECELIRVESAGLDARGQGSLRHVSTSRHDCSSLESGEHGSDFLSSGKNFTGTGRG